MMTLKRVVHGFAMVATIFFALACVEAQVTRVDLRPMTDSLSAYLAGPGSLWIRMGYYALCAGLVSMGMLWVRSDAAPAPTAGLLFTVGGLALIAVVGTSFGEGAFVTPSALSRTVHRWSAFGAFACVLAAMLMQSLPWRRGLGMLIDFWIALLACILFILMSYRVALPLAALQKSIAALIAAWLIRRCWSGIWPWRSAARLGAI